MDWFWRNGRVHPIRSSPGYDQALIGLSEADKNYLRDGERGYTLTSPGRAERVARAIMNAEAPAPIQHNTLSYVQREDLEEARFRPKYKRSLY